MEVPTPYTTAREGEMFLTYAHDVEQAREQFVNVGIPANSRVRAQPRRSADEFRYTYKGETVAAELVGADPHLVETVSDAPPSEPEDEG